jgi:hypothetical protein
MQIYELNLILSQLQFSNKTSWDQTRFISYIIAQVNSSKNIKITDIIKFQWDDNNTEKNTTIITKTEIERLKQKADSIAKNL